MNINNFIMLLMAIVFSSSVLAKDLDTEKSTVSSTHRKLSLVTAEPERVEIDAYPNGDAWSRNTMSGNWGGKRQELADKGIFINMDLTQVVQGFTGGLGGKTRYTGSADLWLNFDTGRLGWWPGGLITLHLTFRTQK